MENKDEIGWDLVAQAKNIIVSSYLNDSLIRKKRILKMKCEQLNIVTYVYLYSVWVSLRQYLYS